MCKYVQTCYQNASENDIQYELWLCLQNVYICVKSIAYIMKRHTVFRFIYQSEGV